MIIKVHSTDPEYMILLEVIKLDRVLYPVDIEDMQKKSYELAVTRIIIAKKFLTRLYFGYCRYCSLTRDKLILKL